MLLSRASFSAFPFLTTKQERRGPTSEKKADRLSFVVAKGKFLTNKVHFPCSDDRSVLDSTTRFSFVLDALEAMGFFSAETGFA